MNSSNTVLSISLACIPYVSLTLSWEIITASKLTKLMNNEHLEYVPNNVTLYCNLITESIINVVIVSLCLF